MPPYCGGKGTAPQGRTFGTKAQCKKQFRRFGRFGETSSAEQKVLKASVDTLNDNIARLTADINALKGKEKKWTAETVDLREQLRECKHDSGVAKTQLAVMKTVNGEIATKLEEAAASLQKVKLELKKSQQDAIDKVQSSVDVFQGLNMDDAFGFDIEHAIDQGDRTLSIPIDFAPGGQSDVDDALQDAVDDQQDLDDEIDANQRILDGKRAGPSGKDIAHAALGGPALSAVDKKLGDADDDQTQLIAMQDKIKPFNVEVLRKLANEDELPTRAELKKIVKHLNFNERLTQIWINRIVSVLLVHFARKRELSEEEAEQLVKESVGVYKIPSNKKSQWTTCILEQVV